MSADVTAREIAAALGDALRRVNERAVAEKWIFVESASRGGYRRLYPVGLLPAEIRTRVLVYLSNRAAAPALAAGGSEAARADLAETVAAQHTNATRETGTGREAALPEDRSRAKLDLLDYFERYEANSGLPRYRAAPHFVALYNQGRIEVPAHVRAAYPTVSASSIEKWQAKLAKGGLGALMPRHGEHRKGKTAIDLNLELHALVLGLLVDMPHASAKLIRRAIEHRFEPEDRPAYRSLQRWLKAWKEENKQLFTAVTNPDAWRSKYKAAGGSASAAIVRLNQRWEIDGTKGDLILADNRRHTLTAIIDVYSRRALIHVSRSSSAAAVAAGLRRAILTWGVPEQIGSDNGSDFVSHHIKRVIAGIGIEHDIAPPYTPEHKPFVERFFGTFNHSLSEFLPGFVGANVTERKAIEARRSFAQRMMKQGGEKIELRMTAEELQAFCDSWTDTMYARDPHSGLGGKTPFAVAAAWRDPVRRITDERALDVLLSPAPDGNGIRTITKKGIRLDNAYFDAPALGGLEGSEVRVLLDDADIGQIYVFALDGPFIAKAICPERSDLGVTRQELAAQRQAHQRAAMSEHKAALRALGKEAKIDTVLHEILRGSAADAEKVVSMPRQSVPHTTVELDEAALAARKPAWREERPPTERLQAVMDRIEEELARPEARSEEDNRYLAMVEAELAKPANVVKLAETDIDRFKRALAFERRIDRGETIPETDYQWLKNYKNTGEYRGRASLYLEFGVAALEQ